LQFKMKRVSGPACWEKTLIFNQQAISLQVWSAYTLLLRTSLLISTMKLFPHKWILFGRMKRIWKRIHLNFNFLSLFLQLD